MDLTLTGLLLISTCGLNGPTEHSITVPAYSWADRPTAWLAAPGCLVRAEVWEIGAWGGAGSLASSEEWHESRSGGLAAAGPLGSLYAGAGLGASSGGADTLAARAAGAWLVTGDPISFMEGFFGPSVSLGAGLEARSISEADASAGELRTWVSGQVALFPTFCLGAGLTDFRMADWGDEGLADADDGGGLALSCTYIFGRELRGHLGFGASGMAVGADLRVSPVLSVQAGTDGEFWACGLSAGSGRITADYGIRLNRSSASHRTGLWFKLGESSW